MPPVVTISASYGAKGDQIARLLAERLHVPFFDRAIPAELARKLATATDIAESLDEHVPRRWERIFMGLANTPSLMGSGQIPTDVPQTLEPFRAECEAKLQGIAGTTGGVILGRAGMVILGNRPDALCVRLDGPLEARIAHAVAQGVDEASARRDQQEVDRARDAYARVIFSARQDDPRLYHLILDSTVLPVETCLDILVRAAQCRCTGFA
jgi:Cytidylate kinase-like family